MAQRARENEQPSQGATRRLLGLTLAALPGGRGQRRLAHPSAGSPGAAHSSTDSGQNCIAEGTPTASWSLSTVVWHISGIQNITCPMHERGLELQTPLRLQGELDSCLSATSTANQAGSHVHACLPGCSSAPPLPPNSYRSPPNDPLARSLTHRAAPVTLTDYFWIFTVTTAGLQGV